MLTKYEEIILVAIHKLHKEAFGAAIKRHLFEVTGKDLNYGNLYCTLDQLVRKRYIMKKTGDPTSIRGGRSKNYFSITPLGLKELQNAIEMHEALWRGVDKHSLETGEPTETV